MNKLYYDVHITTVDDFVYRLRTTQTLDEIINCNSDFCTQNGLICIENEDGTVYTFAVKNILVMRHMGIPFA